MPNDDGFQRGNAGRHAREGRWQDRFDSKVYIIKQKRLGDNGEIEYQLRGQGRHDKRWVTEDELDEGFRQEV